MIRETFIFWFIAYIFIFPNFVICLDEKPYSPQEAQKVLQAIEKIIYEQLSKEKDVLEKVMITESELNSYIAYRIETENEEIMRELRFKLFENNKIEGKVFIDLSNQNIPKFLRSHMTFYFGGELEIQNEKVRLNLEKLFLEGQPIQPKLLDLVIFIASKIENTEVWSINDWFELPYGIKNIETQEGKTIFYY